MKRKKFAQEISDILADDLEMLEKLEPGAIVRPEIKPREEPVAEPSLEAQEPAIEVDQDEPLHPDEAAHHDEPAPHEPSPYVEAVADEPPPEAAPVQVEESPPTPRSAPLRFIWQMDADGRFSLGSDEFTHLIGAHTAAGFGRLWSDIAETFGLDPDGRVLSYNRRFLELWDGEEAAFRVEPPQAVLSFLDDPADALADVVLLLHEPRLADHQLTYRVDVLNGTLPLVGGGCSLFIDSFGQSLAPVAVRGLRRPRRTVAGRTG